MESLRELLGFLPLVALSVLGGVVRQLQREDCTMRSIITGGITAAFVGMVVGAYVDSLGLSAGMSTAIVGASGYAAGDVLNVILKGVLRKACRALGVETEEGK
jgi:cyanate permease